MKQNLTSVLLVACALLASACSSPDGDDTPDPIDVIDGGSEGGTPDGGTPDGGPVADGGASCTETLPNGPIFGDRSVTDEQNTALGIFEALPDGRILAATSGPTGFGSYEARLWNGSQWANAAISPVGATSSFGSPNFGSAGGKFMMASSQKYPADPAAVLRTYSELNPGAFAAGEDLPLNNAFPSDHSFAYLADRNRTGFLVTISGSPGIRFVEKSDGAPWHVESLVSTVPAGTGYSPVAAGYKADGTAFAVLHRRLSSTNASLVLYTRSGSSWTETKTIYTTTTSAIWNPTALVMPEGSADRKLHLAWEEYTAPSNGTVKTVSMDIATQAVGSTSTLVTKTISTQNGIHSRFAASADGKRVAYAVLDTISHELWLGSSVEGGGLTMPKPYRPGLSHSNSAQAFFSRCGKPLLIHRSYENGAGATARYTVDEITAEDLGQ